ncbi:type II toxin-antitoxin system HicA family toxin [Roseomonas elaeocarpi]|uniref:Type II toxin-antitoxin system HicA family toxin n=1 Tax=Roseomonas elaeocarpi TaxID=907779 RepID=A0ABV6JST7_9PROT
MGRTVSSKAVIAAIEADGWFEVAQAGSHKQFKHPTKPGRATVPHPNRELPIGTIKSLERQTGVKLR